MRIQTFQIWTACIYYAAKLRSVVSVYMVLLLNRRTFYCTENRRLNAFNWNMVSRKHTHRYTVLLYMCLQKWKFYMVFRCFRKFFNVYGLLYLFKEALNLKWGGLELLFKKVLLDSKKHTFSFVFFPIKFWMVYFQIFFKFPTMLKIAFSSCRQILSFKIWLNSP